MENLINSGVWLIKTNGDVEKYLKRKTHWQKRLDVVPEMQSAGKSSNINSDLHVVAVTVVVVFSLLAVAAIVVSAAAIGLIAVLTTSSVKDASGV